MSEGAAIVVTGSGPVTSYREAWKDSSGRPVYSWRCDSDQPAHEFESQAQAQSWVDEVHASATDKEREEAGWVVRPVGR
jgi:hypothetical protein